MAQLKKAGKTKPGRSMIKDINEILNTGVCHRLEIFRVDANCQACAMGIHVHVIVELLPSHLVHEHM